MTKPKAGALSLSEQGRRGAFVVHTGRRAAGRVRNGEDPNEVMGDMVAETVQRAHELGYPSRIVGSAINTAAAQIADVRRERHDKLVAEILAQQEGRERF